jgi:prolyl-tRNA synthetase
MQDGKALQAGTSHFLGQNFAKAFDVVFTNKEGQQEHVWATSWGVSTRLIGALLMAHSDDEGLVIPPKLAPLHVVIVPIYKTPEQLAQITEKANQLKHELKEVGLTVKFDDDDTNKPGWKFAEYEMKGVPVRIAIGPRDLENGTAEVARRDNRTKEVMQLARLNVDIPKLLDDIQQNMYNRALKFREENTTQVDTFDDFKKILDTKGGFISAHWDGTAETEEQIKNQTKATIRCIPLDTKKEAGNCIFSGKPSERRVIFAVAY